MITSANTVLTITDPVVFTSPQNIQWYQADDLTELDELEVGLTVMGVDGHQSAAFVFASVAQRIALQADSPSCYLFEQWYAYERSNITKLTLTGTLTYPAINRLYTMNNGAFTRTNIAPSARRTLQGRMYSVMWESISYAPISANGQ